MSSAFLVAVDLSARAQRAVEVAVRLGLGSEVRLDLLHVLAGPSQPPLLDHPSEQDLLDRLAERASDRARHELEALAVQHVPEEQRGRLLLREGPPAEIICDQADTGYDLVVVATSGKNVLGRMLVGSVAEQVVRTAPIPVLVVR